MDPSLVNMYIQVGEKHVQITGKCKEGHVSEIKFYLRRGMGRQQNLIERKTKAARYSVEERAGGE